MTKTFYLSHILKKTANKYPNNIMLSLGRSTYTYQECWNVVNNLAVKLKELEIEGRVAILIPNSPEFIFAAFAVSAIGGSPIFPSDLITLWHGIKIGKWIFTYGRSNCPVSRAIQ